MNTAPHLSAARYDVKSIGLSQVPLLGTSVHETNIPRAGEDFPPGAYWYTATLTVGCGVSSHGDQVTCTGSPSVSSSGPSVGAIGGVGPGTRQSVHTPRTPKSRALVQSSSLSARLAVAVVRDASRPEQLARTKRSVAANRATYDSRHPIRRKRSARETLARVLMVPPEPWKDRFQIESEGAASDDAIQKGLGRKRTYDAPRGAECTEPLLHMENARITTRRGR
jgi:hypothetical protein